MAIHKTTTARFALVLGLAGSACSQPPVDPAPSEAEPVSNAAGSAWIEGHVQRRPGTRVLALHKDGRRGFFTADSGSDGRYRLGPLPPGEYTVSVVPLDHPEHVDNFEIASVTAAQSAPAHADFTQPGKGSIAVQVATPPPPGTLVTGINLFAGSHEDVSAARYQELRRADPTHNRGRNTISAEDLTTTFGGLAPGAYTACAMTNYGENDLRPTCQTGRVRGVETTELTLDIRRG